MLTLKNLTKVHRKTQRRIKQNWYSSSHAGHLRQASSGFFSEEDTCVLCNLAFGNHLLAFRIHHFTVLVLFQTLQHVFWIRLWTKTLQKNPQNPTSFITKSTWKNRSQTQQAASQIMQGNNHLPNRGTRPHCLAHTSQCYSLNWLWALMPLLMHWAVQPWLASSKSNRLYFLFLRNSTLGKKYPTKLGLILNYFCSRLF